MAPMLQANKLGLLSGELAARLTGNFKLVTHELMLNELMLMLLVNRMTSFIVINY